MRLLLWVLLFFSLDIQSQDLKLADDYLEKGEYSKALEEYQKVENKGQANAAMYNNMALIMEKDNILGWTILYLEKALKMEPNNAQTLQILEKIKSSAGIPKDLVSESIGTKLIKIFTSISSSMGWILSLIGLLVVGFYLWKKSPEFEFLKKDVQYLSQAGFFIVVFGLLGFGSHYIDDNDYIVVEKTSMKLSPDESSPSEIDLTEGATVKVIDLLDQWIKVRDDFGDEGWIEVGKAIKI